ncbi:MAG TPA: hypothetical protein VF651_05920 [Gammaproteobacteria bacterium]
MKDQQESELHLTKMNLTWANLKLWFIQHHVYIEVSLLLTMLLWAGVEYFYHPNATLPVPADGKLAWGTAASSFQVIQQGTTLTLTRYRGGAQVYLMLFMFYLCVYTTLEMFAVAIGRDDKPPIHQRIISKRGNWLSMLGSVLVNLFLVFVLAVLWLGLFYPEFRAVTYTEVITISPADDLISWDGEPFLNISQVGYFYGERHGGRIKTYEWGVYLMDGQTVVFNDDSTITSDIYDEDRNSSLVVFLNNYLGKTQPGNPM